MVAGLQVKRGAALWTALGPVARVVSADDARHRTLELELRVSPPLPHGVDGSPLGAVLVLTVVEPGENERFVFASDVQGPLSPVAAAYLIRERPTLLYLSGPPSYIEREVGASVIERGIDNLLRVLEATGCRAIMDHHALRDVRFAERFRRAWETGAVVTAAGYLGIAEAPLESRRPHAWAQARKAPARAREHRAIMTPVNRMAKGGSHA
jgi:predicted metallo-beta-lactamase superfamily hydrolase